MSPPGVMTAATMKMMRIAYLRFDARKRAVTSFIFARKNTTVGIWKTMPEAEQHLRVEPEDILEPAA